MSCIKKYESNEYSETDLLELRRYEWLKSGRCLYFFLLALQLIVGLYFAAL